MTQRAPDPDLSPAGGAVFVSYAREDLAAALAIADALRNRGIEVWFDQKELAGGDVWDAKIRRQIKECALFLAVISRNTNARLEGYFRREWKLAIDRTQDMADEKAFLLPVVIDQQEPGAARVPDKFFEVQWFHLPEGRVEAALAERVRALLEGAATGNTNVPFAVRRSAVGGEDPQPGAKRPPPPREERERPGRGKLWWLAALGLGGVAAVIVVRDWPRPEPRETPKAVAGKPGAAPVKTKPGAASRNQEVRQLIAKATTLWEKGDEATRADWTLAEELCQRAVELDPADGEAWAIFAHVTFGLHQFFHGAGADDLARERAERAVRLQPASKNARLAMANAYRTNARTLPEAERVLRQLVANTPEDKRMLRALGDTLRDRKKYQEAITFYDQAAALPGGDHLALLAKSLALELLGRYDEAEAAVDASLAVRRGSAAMLRKVDCRLNFHGDLEGAARMLARVPAAALLDDRAVSLVCQLWLWKRTPDNSLDLLNSFNRDFLQGYYWAGAPKHWLLGKVHQLAGRPAA
ncbi:MAG: TIR domain-containing protein, partial [Verrucomicrobia bacterium]|nr:TIR domain-containing protein [Verrucomicrobiota bacterium]